MDKTRKSIPGKYAPPAEFFTRIRRGDFIFIASACAEPQRLVREFISYARGRRGPLPNPLELHIQSLGVSPYTEEIFEAGFALNSFFIGDSTRGAVNRGDADYTPISLSQAPELFRRGLARVDAALIQATPPDAQGYMSLGVSVDVVKAAVEAASITIAQVNSRMPKVHGDAFIHVDDIDHIFPYDEPILEYAPEADSEIAQKIGGYISRLIQDGDTLQVGFGGVPNAVLSRLGAKRNLGVHTELLSDGLVELIKAGVIDNSRKRIDRGKAIASFCMGRQTTYDFIDDNPVFEFKTIDYTNSPLVISKLDNMAAINSALEIDLTGQATSESIGTRMYSGVGGQADFMRGAALAGGKTILAVPSTASGGEISRIVPFLRAGTGVTLIRGDVQYVVTEYGIAYLKGKNIRERAMDLIAIAHPRFQPWLIDEAKKAGYIYSDQAFIPGRRGRYPEHLETWRTSKKGEPVLFRPIRISDEALLTEFLYSLSEMSTYRRFLSPRLDMPHERVQELVVIDYTMETAIAAVIEREGGREEFVAVGRYNKDPDTHTAEVAFAVKDEYQNQGLGSELLSYLTYLAKREGLLGFTADVMIDNAPMLHIFEKGGFSMERRDIAGLALLRMTFRD